MADIGSMFQQNQVNTPAGLAMAGSFNAQGGINAAQAASTNAESLTNLYTQTLPGINDSNAASGTFGGGANQFQHSQAVTAAQQASSDVNLKLLAANAQLRTNGLTAMVGLPAT